MDQCGEKFQTELEITSLLSKIRDSHQMLKYIKTLRQHEILKFNSERVIQLSDGSASSSSSSSDEPFSDKVISESDKDRDKEV